MDAPVIAKKASYTASLLLMTAVVLGGCANPDDTVIKKCPAAATLPEAQTLTRFKDGTGRDLIDVNFNGKIIGITGSCSIDVDEDTGEGTIEMKVRPRFEFTRGPANHDSQLTFEYFVVLTDAASNPISEQRLPFKSEFWTNRTVMTDKDKPIELTIPVTDWQGGDDFRVFVGFQLSREELDYNRSR